MEYIIIIITDEKHGDFHYRETLTVRGEKLCTYGPGLQEGLPNMFGDSWAEIALISSKTPTNHPPTPEKYENGKVS